MYILAPMCGAQRCALPRRRQFSSAVQQPDRSARLDALVALAGGIAAFGLLQQQGDALVAEPAPAGNEPAPADKVRRGSSVFHDDAGRA